MSVSAYKDGKSWPLTQQLASAGKTNVQVSNGAGGSTLLAANYNRKWVRMTNIDAAAYVYLSFGSGSTPVAHQGIMLTPIGGINPTFEMDRELIFVGVIKAISTVLNSQVSISDGSG